MAKQDTIRESYDRAVEALFSDREAFAEYLKFSGRFYKLPSSQTITLFDDNPSAQMVADYETWRRFERTVKPNGWATEVISNGQIKRLFDISMTRGEKVPYQWRFEKYSAEKYMEQLSSRVPHPFTNMSGAVNYLSENGVNKSIGAVFSELNIPEDKAADFKRSFYTMVRAVVASRCEWNSDFIYNGSELDLSAADMLRDTGEFETLLEQVQITAKDILKSMENSINKIIYERSIENGRVEGTDGARDNGVERAGAKDMVRGGETISSVDESTGNAQRDAEAVSAERENVRVRADDGAGTDGSGARADDAADQPLGTGVAAVYDGELPGGYSEVAGQISLGADSAQDRQGGVGDHGENAGGLSADKPAPNLGERDILGGTSESTDRGADNGVSGERAQDGTVTENNETAEEHSPAVSYLAVKIAELSDKFTEKYDGDYRQFTLANFAFKTAFKHRSAEYDLNKSVRENVEKMLSDGDIPFVREYLNTIFKEAFEGRIIVDEGNTAEELLGRLSAIEHTKTEHAPETEGGEQLRLMPEPLNKKQQTELEKLTAELTDEFDRWENVFLDGGSDRMYEDGVSLDLIRNHIIYYKHELEEKFPDYLPEIYSKETPPEYPMNYQSVKKGDVLRFEYGDFLVAGIEKKDEYSGEYSVELRGENGETITQDLSAIKTKFRNLTNRDEETETRFWEPSEELNKFYVDRDRDEVCMVYYNPDSTAGGSLVYNYFSFDDIENALSSDRPFDSILDVCRAEWLDKDASVFEESMREFMRGGEDFQSHGNVLPSGLAELLTERKEAVRQDGEQPKNPNAEDTAKAVLAEKEISGDELSARLAALANEISGKQAKAAELFAKQEFSEAAELTREVSELARHAAELKMEIQKQETSFVRDEQRQKAENVSSVTQNPEQAKFFIYQLKKDEKYHDIRFEGFEENKDNDLTVQDYDLVYTGDWESVPGNSSEEKLECIYNMFNNRRPDDFTGHSLSVSDVVAIGYDGVPDSLTAHYVDTLGFTEMQEFFKEKELERTSVKAQNDAPTIIQVAIESTDDFSDSEFHAETDVNTGEIKEYYRLVTVGENGLLKAYDDSVYKSRDVARTAISKDAGLIEIAYDDIVKMVSERKRERDINSSEKTQAFPTITCELSESSAFEDGKTYSVAEFDRIMKQSDDEHVAGEKAALEKYGSHENWINADDEEFSRFLGYDKVKFTLNMPDGTTYSERQDVGDGYGGVIEFLSQYPKYKEIIPILEQAREAEKVSPVTQNLSVTSEKTANDKSVTLMSDENEISETSEQKTFDNFPVSMWITTKSEESINAVIDAALSTGASIQSVDQSLREGYHGIKVGTWESHADEIKNFALEQGADVREHGVYEVIRNFGFDGGLDEGYDYRFLDEAIQSARNEIKDGADGAVVYNLETKKIEFTIGEFDVEKSFSDDVLKANGYIVEEKLSDLERAKELINDFCAREYGEVGDFSDPLRVGLAYTTDEETGYPIEVYADLKHYRIMTEFNKVLVSEEQYKSLDEMCDLALEHLDFDELVYLPEQKRGKVLSPVTKITQVAIESTDDLRIQNAKTALVEYAEYLEHIRLFRSGAVPESEMFLSVSVGVEVTRNRAHFDREVQNAVNSAVLKGINGKLNIAEMLSEARYGYRGEEIEGTSVEDFNALYKEMEENAEFAKALCAEISERLYEPYVRFVNRRQERQKEQRELAEELKQIAESGKKSPFSQLLLKEAELLSPKTEAENFVIEETTPSSFGQKSRYAANIAAIKTLLRIEIENRAATPDEQKILAQYVGWGGIPSVFDSDNASWAAEYEELKALLTPEEYEAARSTVLTAHYTSPTIISAIYSALDKFGFKGGNVLEPAMGIGNFFGVMPEEMRSQSHLHGVELDDISGRIAKQLYPNADIQICGYENTAFSDNFFDAAVGNVPFGNFGVADTRYNRENFLIHDYFFAKTLDKVAPGGVVAFITSKGTLDKASPKVREYLAKRADLIGAIRLPNNAFKANAGTEVTADIIFLQKREKMSVEKPDWCYTAEIAEGISVNQYFIDHPEMILGEMQLVSGRYGEETACVPIEGANLKEQLDGAVMRLKRDIITARRENRRNEEHGIIPATADVRNFTFTEVNDKIYFRENNILREIPFSKRNHERMRGMIGIRNTFRELVDAQAEGCSDETLSGLQFRLNAEYDAFVVNWGHISDIENRKLFAVDDDYNTLCGGLELIDPETKEVTKADVFTKRTIKPYVEVTHVDTPQEALFVSLDMRGFADIEYMAELCSSSNDEVIKELTEGGFLYKNPETEKYEEAAEYLSGYVRDKLRKAQDAAAENPEYERNVAALEKALPPKLGAGDISVRLGAPWITIADYCNFFREYAQGIISEGSYFGRDTVLYRSVSGEYKIENKNADKSVASQSSFGTKRMNSYAIFENLLNNRDIAVYDTFELPDGKKKRVMNKDETQLAQEKARQMKEAFPKWLWSDPERREKYVEVYNELFNSLVGREYDGSHQTFPGMNPLIELTDHQKNAVMRCKLGGNTLLAHCVGAGKTFEMAAAIMEKRRLGLINKACAVVPKHLVGQMSAEWLRLYPEARLLMAKENDFSSDNRQKFIGRCCTGDYDAVIMSYQQFQKIPMSVEFQQKFLVEQIDNLTEQLHDFSGRYLSANDKRSVKDLERMKKNTETKLKKLLDTPHDNSLSFEQLGFDSLVVDEAHNYKNGLVVTKMKNVSGIGSKAAKKSEDFLMKTQYLNEKFGERNLILASGTPVSNSMIELYIMQKYLRPSALQRQGLQNFDDWASTFGEVVSQLELKPAGDGFRMKKRFAKFTNLPELMQTYKDFADIRTAEMLHLPVPEVEGGKPQVISAKPNEFQKAYMQVLAERSEAIHNGSVDPRDDNMLKITNEARLLGLDARCLNPDADNYPNGKVNLLISKVMEIYTETTEQKGVQAIFCDIAINDGKKDTGEIDVEIDEQSEDGERALSAEEQAELLAASKFSVYKYVKEELIRRGIPESEICFAGDAKNQGQRGELYAQLRAGTKRIVLASTTKMGTGANVQTRLCALHNLDICWKPSDFEQRNGRIVRQGNTFPKVKIFNYVTEGTFDAYMLNLIVTKQKFISQLMSGKTPARTCEDVDELVLNYSEMQAIASGDPRIKEKIQLDTDVSRLRLLENEHLNQKYQLEDKVTFCQAQISIAKKQLTLAHGDKDFTARNTLPEGEFKIIINGKTFTERKEAGAELRKAQMTFLSTKKAVEIGEYRGFTMTLNWAAVSLEQRAVSVSLTQKGGKGLTYSTELELQNDMGNITRLENILKLGIDKRISVLEFDITRNEKDLAEALRTKDAPFEYAAELEEKSKRLAQLDAELGVGKKDEIIIDDENQDEDRGKGRNDNSPDQNKKPKRPKH